MKSKKLAVIAIAAGAALVAGTGAAIAVTRGPNAAAQRSGATASLVSAALDNTVESSYTALATPCRVVDTRKSGAGILTSGTKRDFYIGGTTGFAPQGGTTGGCGIPADATAAAATVTMVEATSNGFVHAWPKGATEPGASFMNFSKSFNVSSSGNLSLGSAGQISFKALGATSHVVIDVSGFYVKPMWAVISSTGAIVAGSRVVSASQLASYPGAYEINFDRDVTNCYYSANAYNAPNTTIVEPRSSDAAGVFVYVQDAAGTHVNDQIYVSVRC